MTNSYQTIITDDPAKYGQVGDRIYFETTGFSSNSPPGMYEIPGWHGFDGALMAVQFIEDKQRITGSAVMIAPGVALTAKHVLEDEIPGLQADVVMTCTGFSAGGVATTWNVSNILIHEHSDIAILSLSLASPFPPGRKFTSAVLTSYVPEVGEMVSLVGFRAGAPSFERVGQATYVAMSAYEARGPVEAYYPTGRDRIMMPWPACQIACEALGGMSGGPVFNAEGHVFGVTTSSMFTGDGMGPSFVSPIWPVLDLPFLPVWPSGVHQKEVTIRSLDPRICNLIGRESLTADT